MKKLYLSFDGITDTTRYLFSFAKCLSAALKNSGYAEFSEDIIAASGFAFRMWVAKESLCPSAMSIWEFDKQKPWVENGGLTCGYVGRYWNSDDIEKKQRLAAIEIIKKSVDEGVAAVAWDISGCEWGLITGYDDGTQKLSTFKINGNEDEIDYTRLGKLELPILSVLTVTGKSGKPQNEIFADTVKLALSHYRSEEWCDNAKGLEAYSALTGFIENKLGEDTFWNLEYYLGTYAALKYYAWKFFDKYNHAELAGLYDKVYRAWQAAFDIISSRGGGAAERTDIVSLLNEAYTHERRGFEIMQKI